MEDRSRYRGSLLGLAVGDALGAPFEGSPAGSFGPVEDMVGGGHRGLPVGTWTDDTSMALCLADSLVARRGFDLRDQLDRYLHWLQNGYLSSAEYAFGMGRTTSRALARYELTRDPFSSGVSEPTSAGNGSLMRLAPVPLFFAADRAEAIRLSGESSRATHAVALAVDACRYLGALIAGAVSGLAKEQLLAEDYFEEDVVSEIAAVAHGSFRRDEPREPSGYVVDTLHAALWTLDRSSSFREGALLAVNLGGDTDTTASVFAQLAGTLEGEEAIPEEWRTKLVRRELVEGMADRLFAARVAPQR